MKQPALDEVEGPQDADKAAEGAEAKGGGKKDQTFLGIGPEGVQRLQALRPNERSAFRNMPSPVMGMFVAALSFELMNRDGEESRHQTVDDKTMAQVHQFEQTMEQSKAGSAAPDEEGIPTSPDQGPPMQQGGPPAQGGPQPPQQGGAAPY